MNKYTLLAATAMLSMGAMATNATPAHDDGGANMRTTIHARATMITALEIEETKVLDFGGIINPKAGDVVVVKSDGTLGAGTTAHVLTSSYTHQYSPQDGESTTAGRGISNGQVTISGGYLEDLQDVHEAYAVSESYSFTFPEEITLTANEGAVTCGVVSNIANDTSDISISPSLSYGGTLTVDASIANNLSADSTLDCEGSGTVTVVYGYTAAP